MKLQIIKWQESEHQQATSEQQKHLRKEMAKMALNTISVVFPFAHIMTIKHENFIHIHRTSFSLSRSFGTIKKSFGEWLSY